MKVRLFAAVLLCGSVAAARASSYSELNSGIATYLRGDMAATVQHMSAALADPSLDPNLRIVAYFDRAVSEEYQQKPDAAITDLSAALAIDPDYNEAYSERGDLYHGQRKYALALADYSHVIESRPSSMAGYISRAGVYQDQGNLDAAIADLTYGLSKNPDSAQGYQLRGRAYQLQKQFSKAMADFDKVVTLAPKESGGYLDRGITCEFTGDHKAAQRQLQESLDLSPTAYDAYYYLGLSQWGLGQYAEARKSFAFYIDKSNRPIVDVAIFEWAAAAWSGQSGDARLKLFRDKWSGWPMPIFDYLLGTGTEDAMRAAAKEGDAVEVSKRLCGVDFAVGLSLKTHGASQDARKAFSDTQSICPPLFGEAAMAASELNHAP